MKNKMSKIEKLLVGLSFTGLATSFGSLGTLLHRQANSPYDTNVPIVQEYQNTNQTIEALHRRKQDAESRVEIPQEIEMVKPFVDELAKNDQERVDVLDNAISMFQDRQVELEQDPYISGMNAYQVKNNDFINYALGGLCVGILSISPLIRPSQNRRREEK